jgi:hypothetical protein
MQMRDQLIDAAALGYRLWTETGSFGATEGHQRD